METVKRAYAKPTILKVQLSHEQAVLAACSRTTVNLSNRTGTFCQSSGQGNCRRSTTSSRNDSSASS